MKNVYRITKHDFDEDYYIEVEGDISSSKVFGTVNSIKLNNPTISTTECGLELWNILKDNSKVENIGNPAICFGSQLVTEINNWIKIEL